VVELPLHEQCGAWVELERHAWLHRPSGTLNLVDPASCVLVLACDPCVDRRGERPGQVEIRIDGTVAAGTDRHVTAALGFWQLRLDIYQATERRAEAAAVQRRDWPLEHVNLLDADKARGTVDRVHAVHRQAVRVNFRREAAHDVAHKAVFRRLAWHYPRHVDKRIGQRARVLFLDEFAWHDLYRLRYFDQGCIGPGRRPGFERSVRRGEAVTIARDADRGQRIGGGRRGFQVGCRCRLLVRGRCAGRDGLRLTDELEGGQRGGRGEFKGKHYLRLCVRLIDSACGTGNRGEGDCHVRAKGLALVGRRRTTDMKGFRPRTVSDPEYQTRTCHGVAQTAGRYQRFGPKDLARRV
jgi:hypothetical protein